MIPKFSKLALTRRKVEIRVKLYLIAYSYCMSHQWFWLKIIPVGRLLAVRFKPEVIYSTYITFRPSRPDVYQCLVVRSAMLNMSKNKPGTSMTHVARESKLCSVVRSSMHPCPQHWVAIGRVVVYYARASHSFSAGIKCRHCSYIEWILCFMNVTDHSMLGGHRQNDAISIIFKS